MEMLLLWDKLSWVFKNVCPKDHFCCYLSYRSVFEILSKNICNEWFPFISFSKHEILPLIELKEEEY